MLQVALVVTAICTLFFGVTVFLNNPRSLIYKLYLIFSISSALWMVVNAVVMSRPAQISPHGLLVFSQFITPLALLTSYMFYVFLRLHNNDKGLRSISVLTAIPTLFVSAFSFSHFNVYLDKYTQPTLGILYPLYLGALLFNVVMVFITLYRPEFVPSPGDRARHQQARYLKLGAFTSIVPAVGIGAIVPLFTDNEISNLGPLFSVFFILFSGIAMVRHKLFDIRFFAVRAAAYVTTMTMLAIVYISPIIFLLDTFLLRVPFTWGRFLPEVLLTTVAALSYDWIKAHFNAFTRRIFYRDAYDPAVLLGQFNRQLVSTTDLAKMLEDSAHLIASNLKAEYCVFIIKSGDVSQIRQFGTTEKMFKLAAMRKVWSAWMHTESNVIGVDVDNPTSVSVHDILNEHNVPLLVRLSSDNSPESSFGCILLGYKINGDPYSGQDIETLETIADASVIAIQNALRFEEIQKFNVTLQQRIDDATRKLRHTNAKLKILDETKDDFISMASHQLRTPLTSVKGYLSMVLDGDAGKLTSMQRKMLDQAFVSSQRMVFLIADLLNVSRLKTGKFVIESGVVNLSQTVNDEVKQLKETAKNRSLELQYEKPEQFPDLYLDDTKIRQVIMNFIDNAIYYTKPGGFIRIELIDKPAAVEFKVHDNGIGVPTSEQPHLFTKFYRAGNARRTRPDGTGLGLFMAKKVVVAQGGAVIFDSKEGKGSTFGFMLPKDKVSIPGKAKLLSS